MKKRKESAKVSFCAICAALSFALLFLGTATAVLDMSACVLGGIITVVMMHETDTPHTVCAVTVTFLLCEVLLPDKTVGALYVMLGGLYPIVKPAAEKLPRVAAWALKLAAAELAIAVYVVLMKIFMPSEVEGFFTVLFFVLGTVCFVLYDVLLTRFDAKYETKYARIFRK